MPEDAAIIPPARCEVNGSRAPAKKNFSTRPDRTRLVQIAGQLLSIALCAGAPTIPHAAQAPRWAVAVMPRGEEFSLEIASDPAARQQGYMFREKVGAREGMLFLFDSVDRHPFWMKNCRVHLDIIWLDAAFRVVDVAADLAPCPVVGECPDVEPELPASYVLELAGGQARKLGLKRNESIVVLSDPPLH